MRFNFEVLFEENKKTEVEILRGSVYFKCPGCGKRVYTSIAVWDDHRGDSGWLCEACKEKQNKLIRDEKFAKSFSRMLSRKVEVEDVERFLSDEKMHDVKIDVALLSEYFKDCPPLAKKAFKSQGAKPISTADTGRKVIRIE